MLSKNTLRLSAYKKLITRSIDANDVIYLVIACGHQRSVLKYRINELVDCLLSGGDMIATYIQFGSIHSWLEGSTPLFPHGWSPLPPGLMNLGPETATISTVRTLPKFRIPLMSLSQLGLCRDKPYL